MISSSKLLESDLLAGLREGREDAYAEFVGEFTEPMLRLAKSFLNNEDDAADAVQDAFISAFKAIPRFEGNCSLKTWMHRIVVNACLMKLRSKSRRKHVSIEDLLPKFDETGHAIEPTAPWTENPFQCMESREVRQQVRECIDQLPDEYRCVLILRDIDGFDTEQAADILQTTPGAVKTRLHRARQSLRTLLTPFMST